MKLNYSDDRNIQMLLKILKHNNVRKIIASPGTTNMAFVISVQSDEYFEVYSCVDERSACYMACGLSVESGEPVVLTCTGATASRNYLSGLTEAYYRKIPILALTFAQHYGNIGQNIPQSIDRTSQMNDVVNLSVQIPIASTPDDCRANNLLLNKAVLELKRNGGGPVHINMVAEGESFSNFSTTELPKTRFIDRIQYNHEVPVIKADRIGIFVGSHKVWPEKLTQYVEEFCEQYNAVVLCDHTSNYHGKYSIYPNVIVDQDLYKSELNNFDLLIYIGDVSGAYLKLNSKETWRVNPDGEIRDLFKNTRYIFEMEELDFFEKFNLIGNKTKSYSFYEDWKNEVDSIEKIVRECELPFSNLVVARNLIDKIPDGSSVHLSILNSLRSWNYFYNNKDINYFTNTGGFGIDGPMSTLIGASLSNLNKNFYGVIGDLAFFYDINSLGNRHITNNLRIILINNGCGTEFHNYSHPASKFEDNTSKYIAADGHFGNKSKDLVKNYVENLGFTYISANNENEFLKKLDYFVSSEMYDKSVVFEIFTNSDDESKALKIIRNQKKDTKEMAKTFIKNHMNQKTKDKIKKIVGK